jgi:hypothetical protein
MHTQTSCGAITASHTKLFSEVKDMVANSSTVMCGFMGRCMMVINKSRQEIFIKPSLRQKGFREINVSLMHTSLGSYSAQNIFTRKPIRLK